MSKKFLVAVYQSSFGNYFAKNYNSIEALIEDSNGRREYAHDRHVKTFQDVRWETFLEILTFSLSLSNKHRLTGRELSNLLVEQGIISSPQPQ